MRPLVPAILVGAAATQNSFCGGIVDAFAPGSTRPGAFRRTAAYRTRSDPIGLNVAPIGPELSDHIDAAASVVAASNPDLLHHFLTSSATILADAADVTADAVVEAAKSDEGGWWNTYLNFMKSGLIFVHSVIDQPLRNAGWDQTWGVSIAVFTAGVRGLLVPLSLQQSKSSEYMKALKPYQDEIKEKFADKKEMQNRAIAKLYEDADQNPLAGCLVSLAQLPIFLGLYRSVTRLAKEGQIAEPFLWIPSLEGPVSPPDYRGIEWLTQGWTTIDGIATPSMGWETTIRFLVMPIILVLGQSLTMSVLTPPMDDNLQGEEKEQAERTQQILKFLPLLIGYFSLQVPAGLTIYWLTSNAFTLTQSLAVRKYYEANPPKIELPDYWDALDDVANMSPEERRAAAEAGIATGPKFEDLLDEAKFSYVVDRTPLRADSDAWKRAKADGMKIPEEMSAWANGKVIEIGESPKEEEKQTAEAANV